MQPTIHGEFSTRAHGARRVEICASYLDARDGLVIARLGGDNIVQAERIGSVAVPPGGATIHFEYMPGAEDPVRDTRLWAAHQ